MGTLKTFLFEANGLPDFDEIHQTGRKMVELANDDEKKLIFLFPPS